MRKNQGGPAKAARSPSVESIAHLMTSRFALALLLGVLGVYVAAADQAPGAAAIGMLLMTGGVALAVQACGTRLPTWAARTALGVGALLAASAAFVVHARVVTGPLFTASDDVPSVTATAPPPMHAASVERARTLVRAAVLAQNLPGISVAVGTGRSIVWAEGFGWRDVDTQSPVTPTTRFNIGTGASAVTAPAVAQLGLTNTGVDQAAEWSPEHIGEPEEDFPLFTILRHVVFRPIGLAPARPLAGERATFYVPRSDGNPRTGRRLMYMRDLACCAGTMASYSTAPDLVRIGLANRVSINGELAGGTVMSLATRPDGDLVVAVLSNIARTNTAALATEIQDTFPRQAR